MQIGETVKWNGVNGIESGVVMKTDELIYGKAAYPVAFVKMKNGKEVIINKTL